MCRDFQHLAITFCRCLNIPARYTAGYLGDIGVPLSPTPMDFSAWFEAYLEDRWWTFDARHNSPRIGRVLLATGLDATDVAITTSFGAAKLTHFDGGDRRNCVGQRRKPTLLSSRRTRRGCRLVHRRIGRDRNVAGAGGAPIPSARPVEFPGSRPGGRARMTGCRTCTRLSPPSRR